jgi:PAS domain S-box-containing protein
MGNNAGKRLLEYGVALLAVAVAIFVRWLIDPWVGDYLPLATLFGAVAVAVWFGGYQPALLAVVLGFLACKYLFIEPRGSLVVPGARDLIGLLAYLISCAVMIGFGEALRTARRRAEASREDTLDRQKQLEQAAQKRLEAQQARFQLAAIVESSDDAIISKDLNAVITSWNQGAERLYGYSAQEVIGKPVSLLLPPDQADELSGIMKQLKLGRRIESYETQRQRKDGQRLDVSVTISPIQDDAGRIVGVSAIARDISGRRRSDRCRNARLTVTQLLAEAASIQAVVPRILRAICDSLEWDVGAFWTVDAAAQVVRCREVWHKPSVPIREFEAASRRLTCGPNRSLPGRVWASRQPLWIPNITKDAAFVRAEVAAQEGLHGAFACPVRVGADVLGLIEFFTREIREPDADLLEMVTTIGGQIGQFMARKRAEEAERAATQQLHIVTDGMAAPVTRCSRDLRYLWVSKPYADWIGRPPEEIVGRPIIDILGQEAFDQLRPHFEQVLAGRKAHYEEAVDYKGLGRRWINAVYTPTFDAAGVPDGWVAVVLDITARRQMEEALRQSEQRLAAELAAMTQLHSLSTRLLPADNLKTALDDVLENAIVTSGADFGNIQLYNPHLGALEIVAQRGFQQDFLDYFRTVRVEDGSACAQAMQSGTRILIEDVELDPAYEPHRPVAATAGYRAVQSTPLQSRQGSILGMLSTHFRLPKRVSDRNQRFLDLYARHAADLIERLRSEEALRESEQRFARFMEQLPGLAWIKDLQGRYVYANDAAVKIFRCTRDGLYGKADDEVFPPQTAAQFQANDRRALASETGVQLIETLEHEDGIVHHSVISKFPILGPEGSPAFVGGMAIDITDRLRAEEVLAESEERFRQLAENIKEVFWMADPQTTEMLYISPAYEQVWGQSCQSLYEQPRSFLDAVHPDDRERVRLAAVEKHSRGEATDEEYRVVRPDDSVRWVRDRAFPVRDANGRVYRMVGIAEDITEKKRAEEDLKEAHRRKDEFLATLAHELRNPLAPIRNALELIKRADGNPTLMEQSRRMMERQLAQMVRLIDDLLDISRITRGKLQLRKERVELAAAVQTAVEATRSFIDAQAHQLTVTLPCEPVPLDADPMRLAQVFSNLLHNAAKYTEKGGHIWLTAEQRGGEVVVSVRDTGIGIAGEHLAHIFEMFSQVAPALERSQGGLGIGLALIRGLVELHGGRVEARSAGPGRGSEFMVCLPVVETPVQARPEASGDREQSRAGPKCRILVADDLRDSADSLAMMLRLAGHDTQTAHDGLEAVQAAATFRPDVVVLDIGMPKMNGYEAARHIRQQPWGKHMVLVALTGWGQEEDKRRAMEAGFDHHLTKPVEPVALEKLLAGLKEAR